MNKPNKAIDGIVWMILSSGNNSLCRAPERLHPQASGKPSSTEGRVAMLTICRWRSSACQNASLRLAYSFMIDKSSPQPSQIMAMLGAATSISSAARQASERWLWLSAS